MHQKLNLIKKNYGIVIFIIATIFIVIIGYIAGVDMTNIPEGKDIISADGFSEKFRNYGLSIIAIAGIALGVWRSMIANNQLRNDKAQFALSKDMELFMKASELLVQDEQGKKIVGLSIFDILLQENQNTKNHFIYKQVLKTSLLDVNQEMISGIKQEIKYEEWRNNQDLYTQMASDFAIKHHIFN